MRKILVVGCGGSGGATLGFIMDQLKAELAPHGVSSLPGGWQFVHVDVPVVADTKVITPVDKQGGTYVATGPALGANYATVDGVLSAQLAQGGQLGEAATWLPTRPQEETVPVSEGAGQLRAIGRALTLSKAANVRSGLQAAVQRMFTSDADAEMSRAAQDVPTLGRYDKNATPLVLVVSSMAGGAGASMALDVCRILGGIANIDPNLMGVFMLSPDVFDEVPPEARGGVRANGLAMLGEIVATQTGAAGAHDAAILNALGVQGDPAAIPFKRVFPVGRTMGIDGTLFGDGSMTGVYRGLGRGLAALMTSDSVISDFISFDLTNVNPTPTSPDLFGWGESSAQLQWGSFGFASLSLGRDRYRHYGAQRLARSAVDRLRNGHRSGLASGSDEIQIGNRIDAMWSVMLAEIGLTDARDRDGFWRGWFEGVAFPATEMNDRLSRIWVDTIDRKLPAGGGQQAAQWLSALGDQLRNLHPSVTTAVAEQAQAWAFGWVAQLEARIVTLVERATAEVGIPFARAVVERIEQLIETHLVPRLNYFAEQPVSDPAVVPPAVARVLAATKGQVVNADGLFEKLREDLLGQIRGAVYNKAPEIASRALASMKVDALKPLRDALSEALTLLQRDVSASAAGIGLADVKTSIYAAWPSDADERVPDRFDVAHNEILLTPAAGFDRQYASDVRSSVRDAGGSGHEGAQAQLVTQVISGVWPVGAGEVPPGGLLDRLSSWTAPVFTRHPDTGASLVPVPARFQFHVSTAEILSRALAFVSRRGEAFDDYCSVSLADYASGADQAPPSEVQERHALLESKLRQTLIAALPLAAVSAQAVTAVHGGEEVTYRYKFSNVPFVDVPSLAERLRTVLREWPNTDSTTVELFPRKVVRDAHATRIDVFGSYKPYAPVVFGGLLEPVKEQWAGLPTFARSAFWRLRRSRPLSAALPVGDAERRALIAGWYVGRVTGLVRVPAEPFSDPVAVWDGQGETWLPFPHPLLTPPRDFRGGAYDWLPAVLESQLVALAQVHTPPIMGSLAPYRALRRLYDSQPTGPSGGLSARPAAQVIFADWLRTGTSPGRATPVFEGADAQGRHDAVTTWLSAQRADIRDRFLAGGTAPTADPRTREVAAQTPFFRDLAPDAVWALDSIEQLLAAALVDATTTPTASGSLGSGGPIL